MYDPSFSTRLSLVFEWNVQKSPSKNLNREWYLEIGSGVKTIPKMASKIFWHFFQTHIFFGCYRVGWIVPWKDCAIRGSSLLITLPVKVYGASGKITAADLPGSKSYAGSHDKHNCIVRSVKITIDHPGCRNYAGARKKWKPPRARY